MSIIKKQAEWNGGHAYLKNASYLLPGWVEMAAGGIEICEEYNGFVNVSEANPATITPNTEAWEAWKAAEAEKPEIVESPTQEERLEALESAMLAMMTGGAANV